MPNRFRPLVRALPLAALVLAAGCGGASRLDRRAADDGAAAPDAELTLLLERAPDLGGGPFPRSAGEALIFAQLYETLTVLDARGRARPGLAARWRSLRRDRVWIFTLRADARFWNGAPLTAEDVLVSWFRARRAAEREGLALPLVPGGEAMAVGLDGPGRVRIELPHPDPRLPERLAQSYLAVRANSSAGDLGSGPCRLADSDAGELVCVPNAHHPHPARWRRLRFVALDPEALPELGPGAADGILLEDARLDDYLAAEPGLIRHELPAERRYGLLLPVGEHLDLARWRDVLRRDLSRGLLPLAGVRPVDPALSSWLPPPDAPGARRALELALDGDDPVARVLGRRVAALAAGPDLELHVEALDGDAFRARLRRCAESGLDQPFLLGLWRSGPRPATDGHFRPLAIQRPRLLLLDTLRGLEIGGDGWPRLGGLGPAAERVRR